MVKATILNFNMGVNVSWVNNIYIGYKEYQKVLSWSEVVAERWNFKMFFILSHDILRIGKVRSLKFGTWAYVDVNNVFKSIRISNIERSRYIENVDLH